MRRVILIAAMAGGLAAGAVGGADAGGGAPFTRAAPLPPGEHAILPEAGQGVRSADAPVNGQEGRSTFNLLGKPKGLSREQLALGQEVMALLKVGSQMAAEGTLSAYVDAHPGDQKGLLLQGAVIRSRLGGGDATGIFSKVVSLDGTTAEGRAAKAILEDGDGKDPEKALGAYQALTTLFSKSDESQTIDWLRLMAAEESGQTDFGNDGTEFESRMFSSADQPLMAQREMAELMVKTDNVDFGEMDWRDIAQIARTGWSFRGLALAQAYCHHDADAEASAKRVTDLEPKNVEGWLAWAEVLALEGKTEEVVKKLTHAGELEPKNAAVELAWGRTLLNAGDVQGAAEHAQRAMAFAPRERAVHTLLGRVLAKEGEAEAAKEQFEIAVQPAGKISEKAPALPELLPAEQVVGLKPVDACAQVMKYLAAGEQTAARGILDKLVKEYPTDQDVCFLNGVWLFPSIITDDQGKTFLAKSVAADPSSEKGRFAALMLKVFADPSDRASFNDLCAMVETEDQSPLYLWAGGIVATNRGDTVRTLEFDGKLSDYFVIGPEIFRYQYARALCIVADFSDALPQIEMSVRIDAGGSNQVQLGWVLGHLRQFGEADAAFTKGLPYAEQFAYRWYDWGYVLERWGHQEDAIEKYERAIALDPADDWYFQKLRESLRALGNTGAARSAWLDAVAIYRSKGEAAYAKELQAEVPKGK